MSNLFDDVLQKIIGAMSSGPPATGQGAPPDTASSNGMPNLAARVPLQLPVTDQSAPALGAAPPANSFADIRNAIVSAMPAADPSPAATRINPGPPAVPGAAGLNGMVNPPVALSNAQTVTPSGLLQHLGAPPMAADASQWPVVPATRINPNPAVSAPDVRQPPGAPPVPDFDRNGWLNPQSKFSQFFDQQYDPVREIALKRNVDPALILGLSAHETGWGTNPGNYGQRHNPWGATPKGGETAGLDFPSYAEAWQAFDRNYGDRIQDVGSDVNAFVNRLETDNRGMPNTDGRGKFNSEGEADWRRDVPGAIKGVQKRLPYWRGNLDSHD